MYICVFICMCFSVVVYYSKFYYDNESISRCMCYSLSLFLWIFVYVKHILHLSTCMSVFLYLSFVWVEMCEEVCCFYVIFFVCEATTFFFRILIVIGSKTSIKRTWLEFIGKQVSTLKGSLWLHWVWILATVIEVMKIVPDWDAGQ